jgi:hypothetical protein
LEKDKIKLFERRVSEVLCVYDDGQEFNKVLPATSRPVSLDLDSMTANMTAIATNTALIIPFTIYEALSR